MGNASQINRSRNSVRVERRSDLNESDLGEVYCNINISIIVVCWCLPLSDNRIPKQLLFGELTIGTRTVGRPLLRWKDSLKDTLKQSNISTTHWQDTATDRSAWRRSIHDGLVLYDDSRRERNATKRARRHAARNATSSASQDAYMCRHCGRTCSSRIGILSHERACNKQKRTWHMTAIVVSTGSITYLCSDHVTGETKSRCEIRSVHPENGHGGIHNCMQSRWLVSALFLIKYYLCDVHRFACSGCIVLEDVCIRQKIYQCLSY